MTGDHDKRRIAIIQIWRRAKLIMLAVTAINISETDFFQRAQALAAVEVTDSHKVKLNGLQLLFVANGAMAGDINKIKDYISFALRYIEISQDSIVDHI